MEIVECFRHVAIYRYRMQKKMQFTYALMKTISIVKVRSNILIAYDLSLSYNRSMCSNFGYLQ